MSPVIILTNHIHDRGFLEKKRNKERQRETGRLRERERKMKRKTLTNESGRWPRAFLSPSYETPWPPLRVITLLSSRRVMGTSLFRLRVSHCVERDV